MLYETNYENQNNMEEFNEERLEIHQFKKMGLLFQGPKASSNTQKININRFGTCSATSTTINGILRVTQVQRKVESNTERNLYNQSTSPRSFLLHFHTGGCNPILPIGYSVKADLNLGPSTLH